MMQCNIEIFDYAGTYKDSVQLEPKTFRYDYLTPPKNSIQMPISVDVAKGDWIFLHGSTGDRWGIVSGVTEGDVRNTVAFSDFLNMFDTNVHVNTEKLEAESVERWIADIIAENYVSNVDNLQNIKGLTVVCDTETEGQFEYDNTVVNMLKDVMYSAITKFNIVLEPVVNRRNNNVELHVLKKESRGFVIEADLPNILQKKVTIGSGKTNKNKITVIHKEDESEQYTFYLLEDGSITEDPEAVGRITPVIADVVLLQFTYKEPKEDEEEVTFHDKAVIKASQALVPEKYNNLIELTLAHDDEMLQDMGLEIGEEYKIISGGKMYASVLTGYEIADKTKLIFGSIRDEFTKILRRALR